MYYIGLDIASEKHDCCILNERKKTVQSFSFPNSSDGFDSLLAALAELPSDEIKIYWKLPAFTVKTFLFS